MDAAAVAGTGVRRDLRVMSLIGGAHFFSHFYQLVLPPLFPLLKEEFGVSYAALGVVSALLFVASGAAQAPAGFLVDRLGARKVLLGGLGLCSGAIALMAVAQSYWMLLPLAVASGLGNAVFHPADYAILNASIHPTRVGRAFGLHGITGNVGWAAAPPAAVMLTTLFGWHVALLLLGAAGLAMTVYLASQAEVMTDHRKATADLPPTRLVDDVRLFVARPILMIFAFFVLSSMALVGVQNFVPPALMSLDGVPLSFAAGALTAFLLAAAGGTFIGGFVADRTRRRDLVLALGLLFSGVFFLVLVIGQLPAVLIMAALVASGAALGSVGPSRDMVIREATPVGSAGKVYGFVYSGLDLGAAVTPPIFGWLMDRGEPRLIFIGVALLMVASIATVTQLRRASSSPALAE